MIQKEISATAIYNDRNELIAIVAGERDPMMYTTNKFSKKNYEDFLDSFNKDKKIKE